MDLTQTKEPFDLKRRSELLNSKVFSRLVEFWHQGFLRSKWLDWLLGRYEVHSSVAAKCFVDEIRRKIKEASNNEGNDKLASLHKKDGPLMQRLEQLSFEPGYDVDAATHKFAVEYIFS